MKTLLALSTLALASCAQQWDAINTVPTSWEGTENPLENMQVENYMLYYKQTQGIFAPGAEPWTVARQDL